VAIQEKANQAVRELDCDEVVSALDCGGSLREAQREAQRKREKRKRQKLLKLAHQAQTDVPEQEQHEHPQTQPQQTALGAQMEAYEETGAETPSRSLTQAVENLADSEPEVATRLEEIGNALLSEQLMEQVADTDTEAEAAETAHQTVVHDVQTSVDHQSELLAVLTEAGLERHYKTLAAFGLDMLSIAQADDSDWDDFGIEATDGAVLQRAIVDHLVQHPVGMQNHNAGATKGETELEPEPEPEVDADALPGSAGVHIEEWTVDQVIAWTEGLDLPGGALANGILRTAFEEGEIDGDELLGLRPKRLAKLLRKAGMDDPDALVAVVLPCRDEMLVQQQGRDASTARQGGLGGPDLNVIHAARVAQLRSEVDQRNTCSICFESYSNTNATVTEQINTPRIMTACGHTFCQGCLAQLLAPINGHGNIKRLNCPKCRKASNVPQGQAQKLPQNFDLLIG
jgi:hypothetical protein